MVNYCTEHDRVELKLGKCWACGEVPGELAPKRESFKNQILILLGAMIGGNLLLLLFINIYS